MSEKLGFNPEQLNDKEKYGKEIRKKEMVEYISKLKKSLNFYLFEMKDLELRETKLTFRKARELFSKGYRIRRDFSVDYHYLDETTYCEFDTEEASKVYHDRIDLYEVISDGYKSKYGEMHQLNANIDTRVDIMKTLGLKIEDSEVVDYLCDLTYEESILQDQITENNWWI